MASLDDVAQLALALPGVTEEDRRGQRTWRVNGKTMAWERTFSKADIRRYGTETPPRDPIVAVAVADLGDKDAVLGEGRPGFFTIPHFEGYAAVLLELRAVTKRHLREAVEDAWMACAPARVVDEHLRNRTRRR